MRLFSFALLTFSLAAVPFQAPTVGPLSLGMTAAQAGQALGPSYKDTLRLRGASAGLVVHTFTKTNANDEYSIQTIDDKVFYIGHSVLFNAGAQPGYEDTRLRLLEKYGPASRGPDDSPNHLTWEFDRTGTRLPNASACYIHLTKIDGTDMTNRQTQADLHFVGGVEATAPCFTRVVAILNNVIGEDFIQGLEVQIWNLQAYRERMRTLDMAGRQKQQQQDDAVRKASKAPL